MDTNSQTQESAPQQAAEAAVKPVVLTRPELDLMREAAHKDARDPYGNDGVEMVKAVQDIFTVRLRKLRAEFWRQADPSREGTWREACELLDRVFSPEQATVRCDSCSDTGLVDWEPFAIRDTDEGQQPCPDCRPRTSPANH